MAGGGSAFEPSIEPHAEYYGSQPQEDSDYVKSVMSTVRDRSLEFTQYLRYCVSHRCTHGNELESFMCTDFCPSHGHHPPPLPRPPTPKIDDDGEEQKATHEIFATHVVSPKDLYAQGHMDHIMMMSYKDYQAYLEKSEAEREATGNRHNRKRTVVLSSTQRVNPDDLFVEHRMAVRWPRRRRSMR